jgi:hypothetical protein
MGLRPAGDVDRGGLLHSAAAAAAEFWRRYLAGLRVPLKA